MERSKESVFTKVENKIATIEFGHLNENQLDSVLLTRLEKAFVEIEYDRKVSLVVLKSQKSDFFCRGLLPEVLNHNSLADIQTSLVQLAQLFKILLKYSKPIVARVDGKIVNDGLGLIACCDYVFATEASALQINQMKKGLAPLVTQLPLTDCIGTSGFDRLVWSPKTWQNAYWALEKGLYHRVFEKISELDEALELFLNELSQFSLEAMKTIKDNKLIMQSYKPNLLEKSALTAAKNFYHHIEASKE
ncbi:enoyl-CoA hydratase/isomerase family protein [Aquimarina intermedia]|uniref:Methylglutaconyl-CoA hydratase n=1 Tax=Aquimarina intermedia TaxID=350814 RepID=A0A5S5CCB4_9FLAO|nr:enoyl-CoA hydratase/isomerase family protein [Aquimarina intermedia]TYP77011.1 methylglutaconyl-CoA hydratase [Aquimarina intermedia]